MLVQSDFSGAGASGLQGAQALASNRVAAAIAESATGMTVQRFQRSTMLPQAARGRPSGRTAIMDAVASTVAESVLRASRHTSANCTKRLPNNDHACAVQEGEEARLPAVRPPRNRRTTSTGRLWLRGAVAQSVGGCRVRKGSDGRPRRVRSNAARRHPVCVLEQVHCRGQRDIQRPRGICWFACERHLQQHVGAPKIEADRQAGGMTETGRGIKGFHLLQ